MMELKKQFLQGKRGIDIMRLIGELQKERQDLELYVQILINEANNDQIPLKYRSVHQHV